MNTRKLLAAAAVLTTMVSAQVALADLQAPETTDVVVSIGDAFIPSGFDSGSDAFIVVNGYFPNSCYEWKEAQVDHENPMLHQIRSIARVKEGICLMMLVPFSEEVQLGKLERGTHTLHFMNGDGTYLEKQMSIN